MSNDKAAPAPAEEREALERIARNGPRVEATVKDDAMHCPQCDHWWDMGALESHDPECAYIIAKAALRTRSTGAQSGGAAAAPEPVLTAEEWERVEYAARCWGIGEALAEKIENVKGPLYAGAAPPPPDQELADG